MKKTAELLGARIREIRKAQKLSQEKLAEMVGVDYRYISVLELGKKAPSLEMIEKIATALGVEIRELFDFEQLTRMVSLKDIEKLLEDVDDEAMRQLILRVTKSVVRAVKLQV